MATKRATKKKATKKKAKALKQLVIDDSVSVCEKINEIGLGKSHRDHIISSWRTGQQVMADTHTRLRQLGFELIDRRKPSTALVLKKKSPATTSPQRPTDDIMGLAEYGRRQKMLAKFVKDYLVQGDNGIGDYGYIVDKKGKRVVDKLVLFKPGAEKIAELYRFGVKLTCVKEDINYGKEKKGDQFFAYTYRCDVFSLAAHDIIIAQCEADANSSEKTFKNWDGSLQPANSIRKRAQKRAYVGAIIMATRSSQWFTQDLEEKTSDGGENTQGSAKPKKRLAKEQQLHMLAEECGDTKKETEAYLTEYFGNKSATKLKPAELDALIERMVIARDVVGIGKGHGYTVEQFKQGLTMKYEFTSWLAVPIEKLRDMLVRARKTAGGAS